MRTLAIVLALSVAACGHRASDAAFARYKIVAESGTAQERCDAAREIDRAFLQEQDQHGYELSRQRSDTDCLHAQIQALG